MSEIKPAVRRSIVDSARLPFDQIGRVDGALSRNDGAVARPQVPGFDKVLRESVSGLKFSAHAEDRMTRRNIELSIADLERLGAAVNKIAAKGGRESLVFVDDKAFVVSVKNKTVVTALVGASVREGVFTNIDSAAVS